MLLHTVYLSLCAVGFVLGMGLFTAYNDEPRMTVVELSAMVAGVFIAAASGCGIFINLMRLLMLTYRTAPL
jgi:hypothetical protein